VNLAESATSISAYPQVFLYHKQKSAPRLAAQLFAGQCGVILLSKIYSPVGDSQKNIIGSLANAIISLYEFVPVFRL
jgi:hypothetical protein